MRVTGMIKHFQAKALTFLVQFSLPRLFECFVCRCVVFNNADDIRDAYNRNEFSGRYGYDPFHEDNVSLKTKGLLDFHSKGAAVKEENFNYKLNFFKSL